MKVIYKIYFLLAVFFLLAGCETELSEKGNPSPDNRIVFSLRAIQGSIKEEAPGTRALDSTLVIRQLRYVITGRNGGITEHRWQYLAADLSSLTLEGLPDGDYSIAFFATTDPDKETVKPEIDGNTLRLTNPDADKPFDTDYLFSRVDFSVDAGNGSRTIPVALKRCVGRVEVEINEVYPYTDYYIRKVELTFDDDAALYTSVSGEPEFSGNGTVTGFDITRERGFYSLPSQKALSGTVRIESFCDDGTIVEDIYHFSDVVIEEGKIARIKIDWKSANGNKGFFHVRESDYTVQNSDTMFLPDEPQEVFYDASRRSFRTDQPLKITINDKKELQMQFYSPITLHDVTILCRFKKLSTEFFKLAHYETIPGFIESRMYLPVVDRSQLFVSADGRNVVVPAQPGLTTDDCEFKIETDHPYMAKIAEIGASTINIRFSAYSANKPNPGSWRNMTPELCRHACVLAVNLSYMFSLREFEDRVFNWAGNPLKDDKGNLIPPETVIRKARNVKTLVIGTVGGVGGLGGGSTYGLVYYCYTKQYWDTEGKYSYGKQATFHELGHCMGYGHSSTMTYGDAWTRLCQEYSYDLGSTGRFPVSNSDWASNYK